MSSPSRDGTADTSSRLDYQHTNSDSVGEAVREKPERTRRRRGSLVRRLGEDVTCRSLIIPLIATSFVTGILDASTYQLFATFASNQTGNVILLAVGASGIMRDQHTTTLYNGISLAGYLVCGFIFGHLGNVVGPRRRWWLLTSHTLQTLMLASVLALEWTATFRPTGYAQWPLLLLLAMSSGIQVAQARTSGIQEVPTAMLSSPMVDLLVDPRLWTLSLKDPSVQPRNRRAMHVMAMTSGAFVGAFLHKARGPEMAILVACVVKVCITTGLVFVRGQERDGLRDEERGDTGCAPHAA